jgi:hypothetical protein
LTKRKDFKEKDKILRLLWCDRHCCLCEKTCGIDIEITHIEDNNNHDIDNGIPVCYDCHAKIGMCNKLHPRGTKFKVQEIKTRREQIYEKYTRQYVAPIQYIISQEIDPFNPHTKHQRRQYPDVSFSVMNLSDYLGTRLRVTLLGMLNGRSASLNLTAGLYTGHKIWNLNPRRIANGHLKILSERLLSLKPRDRFEIRVKIVQTDTVGRDHELLEDGYVYNHSQDYWYFEP